MMLLVVFLSFITIFEPSILANVIDNIIACNWGLVTKNLLVFILIYILISIIKNFSNLIKENLINELILGFRLNVSENILNSSNEDKEDISSGQFTTWMTIDIETISRFIIENSLIIINIIEFFILAIILFNLSSKLAIIIIINFPISAFMYKKFGERQAIIENDTRNTHEKYIELIHEISLGFDIIHIFQENFIIKNKLNKIINENFYNVNVKNIINNKLNILGDLLNGLIYCILLIIACYEIFNENLSIGSFIAFNSYASAFNSSLFNITKINKDIQQVSISIERIKKFFVEDSMKEDKKNNEQNNIFFNNDIEFNNVSFNYKNQESIILDKLSFKIINNEINGIVGKNGAGKTTILRLLMKLSSGYSGEIKIGETELREIDNNTIYNNITYVPQNPFLFTGSIKENLLLANNKLKDYEISEVCKLVDIDDYIESLKYKYDTIIGKDGINLSIGQKQRLTIARGLLRKSEIFLFDEITSAVDSQSEKIIIDIINKLIDLGKTVVIVSHKESIIKNCQNIIKIGI